MSEAIGVDDVRVDVAEPPATAASRFELKFQVEPSDADALSRQIHWTVLERIDALLPTLGVGLTGAFLGACVRVGIMGHLPNGSNVHTVVNSMVVGGFAAYGLFLLVLEPMRRRSYLKERPVSMGETVFVAEGQGVTMTSMGIATALPWPCLKTMSESEDHIFLMHSRLEGLVVPKRAFNSPEQIKGFLEFVRSKIPATMT